VYLPLRSSRSLPILRPRVSSSFICTYIASTGWNLAYTDFGLHLRSWSESRVATSASRPLV
jgi:hypothetical protein